MCRILALSLVFLAGACRTKGFEHADPNGSGEFESFTSASGGSTSDGQDGNFPEPALTRCGDVLGEMPAIEGLAAAWAVVAVPGATVDGEPLSTGSVVLRLSEVGLQNCGASPGDPGFFEPGTSSGSTGGGSTGGSSGSDSSTGTGDPLRDGPRGLELTLTADEFAKGTYAMSELVAPRVYSYGAGSTTDVPQDARIQLHRVDADCVVGTVSGFRAEDGTSFMEGSFVAQTCQRQCIPGREDRC